jgi:multidrug efflux pump subunit AcrA (membrane-fusion protein)
MSRIYVLFLSLLVSALPVWAGPGHDHGHETAPDSVADFAPRLESAGSEVELVATAEGRKLTIYLDRLETNEPVDEATIEVSGEGLKAQSAARVEEGVYTLEADWVAEPGTKALTFVVATADAADLLNGTLEIPQHSPMETAAGSSLSALLARAEFWLIVGLAALFGFVLAFAFRPARPPSEEGRAADTRSPSQDNVVRHKKLARVVFLALGLSALLSTAAEAGSDHDHGDVARATSIGGDRPHKLPDGDVFVPKSTQRLLRVRTSLAAETETQAAAELVGTIIADPASEGRVQSPMDGKIELADGKAAFVGQTVKAGDLMALLSPTMPVYERGYLEQLAAEVDGKFRIAQQRLRRLQNISEGYVAQREIEDTLTELDALREQKHVLEPKSGQKIELRAPVSGTVSVANVRPGHVVNTGDTLFQIVDPARLWVEAIASSEHDVGVGGAASAIAGSGRPLPLTYVGRSPALRQHARQLFFKVESEAETLAIGEVVKVSVQTGAPVHGILLPEDAVVRGPNGLPYVWEKVSAERFRPRPVTTRPLAGTSLLLTAGLESGTRVVVEGAELINQIR